MDLVKFRVTNYRNIIDSGDVEVGRIASIVGANESGKSNLLLALRGLNPFDAWKYVIAQDWPIDNWPPKEEDAPVCQAQFNLSGKETAKLFEEAAVPPEPEAIVAPPPSEISVVVSKGYANKLKVDFGEFAGRLKAAEATQFIAKRVPKCVYMSDYEIVKGFHGNFPDLHQRHKANGALTEEERTLMIAMELAALDLAKVASSDTPQRTFYTTASSSYLTQRFADLWKQRHVKFDIRVDGNTLKLYVEDEGLGAPIPLELRSAGFQWYVSFIWRFTHASDGMFKNCILLLDEPGVKLHHAGHADLLEFLAALSEKNVVLYSTHVATMIDQGAPERIRIMELQDHHGSIVNWVVSEQRTPMMVVEARLGLAGSMGGLLGSRQNLIVEGVDDMLILQKLSGVLRSSGEESLSDRIFLIPANGASSTPLFAAFMIGNGFDAAVLVDTDEAGRTAIKRIKNQRVPEAAKANLARFRALELGEVAGSGGLDFAIEDMFPDSFYLACVNEAYGTNLSAADIDSGGQLVKRCQTALQSRGRISDEIDKGRIMAAIQKRFDGFDKVASLPQGTAEKARKVIMAINRAFS